MSWDVDLYDDRGHLEGEWNYTHNTNPMINRALELTGIVTVPWYQHLDGMSGPEGAAFLDTIIKGLEDDPIRYEAMNPANNWGSYTGLLRVLREMRASVPEWPCQWSANG